MALTAGEEGSCLLVEGRIWCWGHVPVAEEFYEDWPKEVEGDEGWLSLSLGHDHVCGLKEDGSLWCWGSNLYGQLGLGEDWLAQLFTPRRVGEEGWRAVSAGYNHTCAIKADGTLWCWGRRERGPMGPEFEGNRFLPEAVGSEADWRALGAVVELGWRGRGG